MTSFSAAQIEQFVATGDDELLRLVALAQAHALYTFEPRPDCPSDFDEQTAFVTHTASKFAICLGGTGSGKTVAAAYKTARYVLHTPPPRPACPFWIVGEYFDQICKVGWVEKLSQLIPADEILHFHWYQAQRRWPRAVVLRHPVDRERPGWVLEFKSYEQGIGAMKAESIGGYWFNEEVPYHLVFEVQGRCRDYDSPGWADFTPVECKDPEWIAAYNNPPEGWRFFHLNTLRNTALAPGWADRYLRQQPEDMRELRTIGRFTTMRGAVYKEFRREIHVIEPFRIPKTMRRLRGIDFGFVNAFVCLWVAVDDAGRYFVYDEYYSPQKLIDERVAAIQQREWDGLQPWFGPTFSDHDAQWRKELGARGIPCTPANKAINHGIAFLRSLLLPADDGRPKLFLFNTCAHLIREMIGYKWPAGTDLKNPREQPIDKDNDTLDALRYAIYSDHTRVGLGDAEADTMKVTPDHWRHGIQLKR